MTRSIVAVAVLVLAAGCSTGTPTQFDSAEALYARAQQELADEDWTDAALLLERLKLEYPTFSRMQEARYELGNAYFGKREYVTAANEFLRLAADYPTGPYADDARFRVCEAYRALSPIVARDQQYTAGAIDHCQALVSYYPTSEFVPRAQEIIVEMTNKLAAKLLETAEHYRDRNAFDPAIIYYELVLQEYPRTPVAAEALYRMHEVYTRLGYAEEAKEARERLIRDYPDSAAAKRLAGGAAAGSA